MRRIKLVVLTVGVALSATPIFNSAFAQQRTSNQASLLLEMQSIRQEVAQLRDMVERQQYDARKLKKQQTEMQRTIASMQMLSSQGHAVGASEGLLATSRNESVKGASLDLAGNATLENAELPEPYSEPSGYQDEGVKPQSAVGVATPVIPAVISDVSEQRITTTEPHSGKVGAEQAVDEVPVIDRSFIQQAPTVPITGKGADAAILKSDVALSAVTVANNEGVIRPKKLTNPESPSVSDVSRGMVVSPLPATVVDAKQATQSLTGGVIAVPPALNDQKQHAAEPLTSGVKAKVATAKSGAEQLSSHQVSAAKNVLAATDATANGAPTLSEDDYYTQGFELLKQSKYEEAAIIFERQIKAYPRGNLADDAHYWVAEAMHVSRKLVVSKRYLNIIIRDYPQSPRLADAKLKLAYIEQSQGNKMESQVLFQEIVSLHPKSDAAIAAKNQLASSN